MFTELVAEATRLRALVKTFMLIELFLLNVFLPGNVVGGRFFFMPLSEFSYRQAERYLALKRFVKSLWRRELKKQTLG